MLAAATMAASRTSAIETRLAGEGIGDGFTSLGSRDRAV